MMLNRILQEQQLPQFTPAAFFPCIAQTYLEDETITVERLLKALERTDSLQETIRQEAFDLVSDIRADIIFLPKRD